MTVVFTDNFNRANDTNLGGNWVEDATSGGHQISGNALVADPANTNSSGDANFTHAYNTSSIGSVNYSVAADAKISVIDTSVGAFVVGRRVDSSNFYALLLYAAGTTPSHAKVFLRKRVAGTTTDLATSVDIGTKDDVVVNLKLVMDGSSISGYVDGVLTIGPVTDTALTAEGNFGVRTYRQASVAVTYDNLVVDTITGGGGGSPIKRLRQLTGGILVFNGGI